MKLGGYESGKGITECQIALEYGSRGASEASCVEKLKGEKEKGRISLERWTRKDHYIIASAT